MECYNAYIEDNESSLLFILARTYTDQALHIVDNLRMIAKRDHTVCRSRGFSFHESGYIYLGTDRIGHAAAVQGLAETLEREELAIEENKKPTAATKANKTKGAMTWDSLNEATKAYFFELAEMIQDDVGVVVKIGLRNAPRLTNLKRVGLIAKNGKGLEVTAAGRALRNA